MQRPVGSPLKVLWSLVSPYVIYLSLNNLTDRMEVKKVEFLRGYKDFVLLDVYLLQRFRHIFKEVAIP